MATRKARRAPIALAFDLAEGELRAAQQRLASSAGGMARAAALQALATTARRYAAACVAEATEVQRAEERAWVVGALKERGLEWSTYTDCRPPDIYNGHRPYYAEGYDPATLTSWRFSAKGLPELLEDIRTGGHPIPAIRHP